MRITLLLLLGILGCNAIYDRLTDRNINTLMLRMNDNPLYSSAKLYSKSLYNTTKMNTIIDDIKILCNDVNEYIKDITIDLTNIVSNVNKELK